MDASALELASDSGAESGAESGLLTQRVLLSLQEGSLSKSELAHALGLSGITGALNRSVAALLEQALIERTISDKPQSRLQKYRLTAAGRQCLLQADGRMAKA